MDENGNLDPADFQPNLYQNRGPKSPESALSVARIVWFAMLVSQGMYLMLGPILINSPKASSAVGESAPSLMAGLQSQIGMVGALVAASFLGMSFLIPTILSNATNFQAPGRPRNMSLPNRLQAKLVKFVIGVALNESVAVTGLAVGFIFLKNAAYGSALVYLSIAGMLARFPAAELFVEPNGPRSG